MESFVKFLQLYSDKTTTTLNTIALVAYPFYFIPLNISAKRGQELIDSVHRWVGFLRLGCTHEQLKENGIGDDEDMLVYRSTSLMAAQLESGVRATAGSVWRDVRSRVLYEATKVVVGHL